MIADPGRYAGHEQAYVKHYFLESYLERLVHKTASAFGEIAYVDGFSGPWHSSGENLEDTSFGIALSALQKAKASWKNLRRDVRMSAYLVERSSPAYKKLGAIRAQFPDIVIHTYNGDFVEIASKLLGDIPTKAFAFLFIDPTGWRIEMQRLAPLLSRRNSEVVFNFMFDFINRAASINDPVIVDGLSALMPYGSWKEKLKQATSPETRKVILIEAFSETLSKIGGYAYVAETPVLQRIKDRTHYSLIYGTRRPPGIEVFRDCQIKTLREQASIRTATKRQEAQRTTGQSELFGADVQVRRDEVAAYLKHETKAAEATLVGLTPASPQWKKYGDIWPHVLAKHAVRLTDVNAMATRLKKSGALLFHDWRASKRVPDDIYRMSRPASGT